MEEYRTCSCCGISFEKKKMVMVCTQCGAFVCMSCGMPALVGDVTAGELMERKAMQDAQFMKAWDGKWVLIEDAFGDEGCPCCRHKKVM